MLLQTRGFLRLKIVVNCNCFILVYSKIRFQWIMDYSSCYNLRLHLSDELEEGGFLHQRAKKIPSFR